MDGHNTSKLTVLRRSATKLGQILFIYLPEVIKSTLQLFADDAMLYKVIKSKKDSEGLQQNLYSLMTWSKMWQLLVNIDNCKVTNRL